MADESLVVLAEEIISLAKATGLQIATAESLTGGILADALVSVPGASDVFIGGVVAYSALAKELTAGVRAETIALHGVVSEETATEMAFGIAERFAREMRGDVIGVSTTGVAGPGSQDGVSAGTFFVAVAKDEKIKVESSVVEGTRQQVRLAATEHALRLLKDEIALKSGF